MKKFKCTRYISLTKSKFYEINLSYVKDDVYLVHIRYLSTSDSRQVYMTKGQISNRISSGEFIPADDSTIAMLLLKGEK